MTNTSPASAQNAIFEVACTPFAKLGANRTWQCKSLSAFFGATFLAPNTLVAVVVA